MPLSSVWAGPASNAHLGGPPLLYAQAAGIDPVSPVDPCRRRWSHDGGRPDGRGQVGAAGADRAPVPALSGRSECSSSTRAIPRVPPCSRWAARTTRLGSAARNGAGETLAFQPLRHIDRLSERAWAADWIAALLTHEKVSVTPDVKESVWSALGSLASAPPEERTLTGLALLLQSNALRSALAAYTLDGPYGRLLDAAEPDAAFADVQCFETEALMGHSGVVAPVLTYLFHRLGRAVRRAVDPTHPRRGVDLPRPSAVRRAHPRMAKGSAQEKCRRAVRDPELRRHRGQQHRAGDHRELPAAHPAAQRPRDRAAESRGLRAVRAQRAPDRADQQSHAQAPLLPPVGARQPAVRAWPWPDRARAVRRVRSDEPAADRCAAGRAWRRPSSLPASLPTPVSTGPCRCSPISPPDR